MSHVRSYVDLMQSFPAGDAQNQFPEVARIRQCFHILWGDLVPPGGACASKTPPTPCIRLWLTFCFVGSLMGILGHCGKVLWKPCADFVYWFRWYTQYIYIYMYVIYREIYKIYAVIYIYIYIYSHTYLSRYWKPLLSVVVLRCR